MVNNPLQKMVISLLSSYRCKYDAGEASVVIHCSVNNVPVDVTAWCDPNSFSIGIGKFLVIDKIEDQDLHYDDVQVIVEDLIKLLTGKLLVIKTHKLLWATAYSIGSVGDTRRSISHLQYDTPAGNVIRRWGRESTLGTLEVV